MKKNLSKGTKSAIAFALATVLAVPTVSVLTAPNAVSADDEALPQPIMVYDFCGKEAVTFSSLAVSNPATIVEDEMYGNVVKLDNSIAFEATKEAATAVTMYAADYDSDKSVGREDTENSKRDPEAVSGGVVSVFKYEKDDLKSYNINSSIEIENPFAGRDDLVEDPVGYLDTYAPIWEKGISISYWMKTNGTGTEETAESPILSFNREKDGMVHKDDRDKYNLAQLYYADKTNPLFSVEYDELKLDAFKEKYPDVDASVDQWETNPIQKGKARKILTSNCGIFACMNEKYPDGNVYYISTSKDGKKKTLEKASCTKQDLSKFYDVFAEGSNARYGTEKGCMTFMASGGYAFTESGLVEHVYKGINEYKVEKESERQFQRNTLHAYTYIVNGNKKNYTLYVDEDYSPQESLVASTEWHYITYVIKNDSVSLYVDGVVQDDAMFTDTKAESTLEVGDSFNKGWGYHNSASEADIIDIKKESGGFKIFTQQEGYLVGGKEAKENDENIIRDEEGKMLIGYNGNCNADTLLEYFTDPLTKLYIGEDGPSSAADLMQTEFGSKADTYVGTISFYDVPLDGDQVAALYEEAVANLGKKEEPTPPAVTEPAVTTPPAVTEPAVTTPPAVTEPAVTTPPAVTEPAVTTPPAVTEPAVTTPPVETTGPAVLGDINGNGKVDLTDVTVILKAALNIEKLTDESIADMDGNGKVELKDATQALKVALNITV